MKSPITYDNTRTKAFNDIYPELLDSIEWVRRDRTPRQEAFYSFVDTPYTYGTGAGIRTYSPNTVCPIPLSRVWTHRCWPA